MISTRWSVIFAVFFTHLATGQIPATLAFSTLPPYTDSNLPNDGHAHALFDFPNNQIVIILPPDQSGGSPRTLRYDVPNRVNPEISWAVAASPSGGYSYSYSLNDDPQSRQRSSWLAVLVPDHDTTLARADTSPWQFSVTHTQVPDRTSTVAMAAMNMVSWSDPSPLLTRLVGQKFALASQYSPGFCAFFVEGLVTNPLTAQALASIPAAIAPDVQRATSPGIGSTQKLAICPLFRTGTSKTVIASNYFLGIQHLAKQGDLDSTSKYFQQLSNYLQNFLSSGGVGSLASPDFEPGPSLERQIQNALSISLQ